MTGFASDTELVPALPSPPFPEFWSAAPATLEYLSILDLSILDTLE